MANASSQSDFPSGAVSWRTWRLPLACIALAAAACWLTYLLEGHVGFSLWDEGHLWYSSQRLLAGDVPIRDFFSYDVGRYGWCAFFMGWLGSNGIMAVRVAALCFATAGVAIGIGLVVRENRQQGQAWFWALLATVVLALWLIPRHKLFDITTSIALVLALTIVLARPQPRRFFFCGLIIGLCAVIGRNHGVYGVIGFCLATLYLAWQRHARIKWPRALVVWGAGVVIGYLPVLAYIALVPGFASAFLASVQFIFQHGTNLPLPIPWPWLVSVSGQPLWQSLQWLALGCTFLALPVFDLLGVALLINRSRRSSASGISPVFAAAVMMSIPYTHYAFSRADVGHLALGLFPLLIGVFTLPVSQPRWPGKWIKASCCGFVVLATLLVALPQHPGFQAWTQSGWRNVTIGNDVILMDSHTAQQLQDIQTLVASYAPEHRVMAIPYWPGFYAWYGLRSPIREIYALFPEDAAFQRSEIARMQRADPSLVMLLDAPLDNNEKLRYSATHPLIYAYIRSHYVQAPSPEQDLLVFIKPNAQRHSKVIAH